MSQLIYLNGSMDQQKDRKKSLKYKSLTLTLEKQVILHEPYTSKDELYAFRTYIKSSCSMTCFLKSSG